MRPHAPDDLIHGLRVPGPPDDLRDRALAAAARALLAPPTPSAWERLWHSRGMRLAWGAACLALAAAHAALGLPPRQLAADNAASRRLPAEVQEAVHLPRIDSETSVTDWSRG